MWSEEAAAGDEGYLPPRGAALEIGSSLCKSMASSIAAIICTCKHPSLESFPHLPMQSTCAAACFCLHGMGGVAAKR
jgi:hypothetical protein